MLGTQTVRDEVLSTTLREMDSMLNAEKTEMGHPMVQKWSNFLRFLECHLTVGNGKLSLRTHKVV